MKGVRFGGPLFRIRPRLVAPPSEMQVPHMTSPAIPGPPRNDSASRPAFRKGTTAIRPAEARDAVALHEVAAATFALACPPDTTPASIAAFIAENLSEQRFAGYLADPSRLLIVAESNDESATGLFAGYTMLVSEEPKDADVAAAITTRPTAELSKVYVREEAHGSGLALALVEATIAAARELGAAAVWLGVNQQNARANRFYERCGFATVGTKQFLVGERWEDDFVRELVLTRDPR